MERGDPGHRIHQHPGGADLRAGTRQRLRTGTRRPASPGQAADRLCQRPCPQLGGQGRIVGRFRSRQHPPDPDRRTLCPAPGSTAGGDRAGPGRRQPALRRGRDHRHHRHHGHRPAAADRRDRPGPWPVAARGLGHGRLGDDLAGMPLDVGRHRAGRFAGGQRAQVAGRGLRLLDLLRARPAAPDPGDEHQPQLPAVGGGWRGEEPA
ncbi:hypothetical protein D3C75_730980 [compost metagenome]